MSTTRTAKLVLAAIVAIALSSCSFLGNAASELEEALKGRAFSINTFATNGSVIDSITGTSVRIVRDTTFDSKASDGSSNADSSVIMVSIGNSHVRHVGSTMIAAENGLTTVASPGQIKIDNQQAGTPWLNDLIERNRNLWAGKGKTILIRSQLDEPLAVYAGDKVEIFATAVPKTTRFVVDGKVLVVYRANYTVYDNDLLRM